MLKDGEGRSRGGGMSGCLHEKFFCAFVLTQKNQKVKALKLKLKFACSTA